MFFASGSQLFNLSIMIIDDIDFEGLHSFSIEFDGGGQIEPGSIPNTTVIISDLEGEQINCIIHIHSLYDIVTTTQY